MPGLCIGHGPFLSIFTCLCVCKNHRRLFGSTNIPKVKPIWYSWLLKAKKKKRLFGKFCVSLSLEMSLWDMWQIFFFPSFFYQCQVAGWLLYFGGSPIRGGRRRGADGGLTRGVNHLQLKSHKTQMNLWPLEKRGSQHGKNIWFV